jgi:hypothetical protein
MRITFEEYRRMSSEELWEKFVKPRNEGRGKTFKAALAEKTSVAAWSSGGLNEDVIFKPFECEYESPEEPRLAELREKLQLDAAVAPGGSHFDKVLLLCQSLGSLRHRWTWGEPFTRSLPCDSLLFMELADKGHRVYCSHFAIILMQCALSLGWQSRIITLGGHELTEIWSLDHRKWIVIDNPRGAFTHVLLEGDSTPINALELRTAWRQAPERTVRQVLPDGTLHGAGPASGYSGFRYLSAAMRNNYLSRPFTPEYTNPDSSRASLRERLRWVDELSPPVIGMWNTSKPEVFNPAINFSRIHLDFTDLMGMLAVTLTTVTPNFGHFETNTDAAGWKRSPASFVWLLRRGRNTLEVTAVNKFGVPGTAASVSVDYDGEAASLVPPLDAVEW